MKRVFTLRKGTVTEVKGPGLYLVQDTLNGNNIITSIPAKMVVAGKSLVPGAFVYVVVSPADLLRGRLFTSADLKTEYAQQLVRDRQHLDRGEDPLNFRK
ncbi:S1 domain-containing protein [Flavilitoribacter nigricans]|uniref:Uncharacterized protein n=1 Tax=Flavilitoribacter nigricans (strain ATCC 23147 / DSM 23189 / NBRC 102662 / NCIMB 1420 / SS-2) TaxID=1122177 RepID=A0A2D0N9W5_FLAN2|nr:hypothetical protein [Flavilitoribacter nigricans]PHN05312.1 hypothetical protein CRP01_17500 [Flavilitoribacter nigricans DSM 23189 = NBRC 102662]